MTDLTDLWHQEARRILRAQLARQGMSFKTLAIALEMDSRAVSNKVNRGTFSFAFFLQCMHAIGTVEVKLKG